MNQKREIKMIIIKNKIYDLFIFFAFFNFFHSQSKISIKNDFYKGQLINENYLKKTENDGVIAWKNYLEPWNNNNAEVINNETEAILLNFNNADIVNVLKYFEELYNVIFITDDAIQPVSPHGKSLYASKINFTSHTPLSKKDAWNVLITLLELAGVTLQPGSMYGVYRVVTLAKESPQNFNRGPLPTFIGVDESHLPEADMRIRFVYQVKNTSLESTLNIIKTMQSPASPDPIAIKEMNAILFVDRVFNIRTILAVINELDKMVAPEEISIIRLKNASANHVVELYKNLIKEETSGQPIPRIAGSKRTDMVTYFDPQIRLVPDQRNNLIIAMGSKEGLKKVENFIINFQDVTPKSNYLPIHTYLLKYTQAEAAANVLKQAVGFKQDSDASKFNGVRNGEKYLSEVFILAEPNTNSLLITCSDENYSYIYDLLNLIDVEPRQVAVDIVIVSIEIEKIKQFGAQLRNGSNQQVNWQTGMLDKNVGVVGNYHKDEFLAGPKRLLGNLLNLVTGNTGSAGTTIVSLGKDENGVWGLVKMLMQEVNAKIINNPFIVLTDKTEGNIIVGETRRIASTSITNANNEQQSYTSDEASLNIKITANINSDEQVFINFDLANSIFTAPEGNSVSAGNKTTRNINTAVLIKDKEMIAIGGLIVDHSSESNNRVPWLHKIPIIGAFFANEEHQDRKSMLVIFVEPKIITCSSDVEQNARYMCEKFHGMYQKNENKRISCPLRNAFFNNVDIKKIDQFFDYDSLRKNFYNHQNINPTSCQAKPDNKIQQDQKVQKKKSGPRHKKNFKKKEIINA
jgi:general secretion pathway protein D